MNAGKPCILTIGHFTPLHRYLCRVLRENGYDVLKASSYSRAIAMAHGYRPDLILLDLDLPGTMDGFAFCTMIRESMQTPIFAISEKADVLHKVRILDMGADDYITKPWSLDELCARIRAHLRRKDARRETIPQDDVILYSHDRSLVLNVARRQVCVNERDVQLTSKEFQLLYLLMLHAGKVLTYQFLLQQVWGDSYREETEYVHVCICQLRKKLDNDYILTQLSVGYFFRDGYQAASYRRKGAMKAS